MKQFLPCILLLCVLVPRCEAAAASAAPEASLKPEVAKLLATLTRVGPVPAAVSSTAAPEPSLALHGDGTIRHLSAPVGSHFRIAAAVAKDAEANGRRFLRANIAALGLADSTTEFVTTRNRSAGRRTHLRYEQQHLGVPVFAGQIILQMNDQDGVEYLAHYGARQLPASASIDPAISADEAVTKAKSAATAAILQTGLQQQVLLRAQGITNRVNPSAGELATSDPKLVWFSPELLALPGEARLAWQVSVRAEQFVFFNERLFIDATDGRLLHRLTLNTDALYRTVFNADNQSAWPPAVPPTPPLPARLEGGPSSSVGDVNDLYDFLGDTFNYYKNNHGRDGVSHQGRPLFAVAKVCVNGQPCPWQNASYSGLPDPPITSIRGYDIGDGIFSFGNNWTKDDIVAHEFTHGVVAFESGLIYQNASGAINEALADIFGEFVDLGNGRGNDDASVRWLVGEDKHTTQVCSPSGTISSSAIRSMKDPTRFCNPDKMSSGNFSAYSASPNTGNDNGGVHSNSGIVNKLAYLLTDGDTFSGQSVSGMGIGRISALFYEVNINLLGSTSDFTDLSVALHQAAANIGWNASEIANLHRACLAVEIVAQGVNNLQAGDTLFVRAGTYNEKPRLTKPMTLRSYGTGSAVIGR
jgi:bacillolysin